MLSARQSETILPNSSSPKLEKVTYAKVWDGHLSTRLVSPRVTPGNNRTTQYDNTPLND